jgi:hypothetical protein
MNEYLWTMNPLLPSSAIQTWSKTSKKCKTNLQIEYCQTDEMDADYITKLLVGANLIKFRSRIIRCRITLMVIQQECVGLYQDFKKI